MRIVLDTNVLVSALISPHGPPAIILANALAGRLILIFDERMLHEYRAVLARPKFGFDQAAVAMLLDALEAGGEAIVATPLAMVLPDPDDLPFLEVAVSGRADALVTGNLRHFADATSVSVYTPADFLGKMRIGMGD